MVDRGVGLRRLRDPVRGGITIVLVAHRGTREGGVRVVRPVRGARGIGGGNPAGERSMMTRRGILIVGGISGRETMVG